MRDASGSIQLFALTSLTADFEDFARLRLPILVVTTEFATVAIWDWEIRDFLRRRGVETVAPTSLQEFEDICRALGAKEALRTATMLA